MSHMERQARFRRQLNAQIKRADIKRVTLGKLTGANFVHNNKSTFLGEKVLEKFANEC